MIRTVYNQTIDEVLPGVALLDTVLFISTLTAVCLIVTHFRFVEANA